MKPPAKFKPTADRVLIRRMPERELTDSGIYKPEAWRDKETVFVVEAVGPGKWHVFGATRSMIADALSWLSCEDLGRGIKAVEALGFKYAAQIPLTVCVGDVVLMGRYSGTDVKLDGVEYSIVREDEILGVLPRSVAA